MHKYYDAVIPWETIDSRYFLLKDKSKRIEVLQNGSFKTYRKVRRNLAQEGRIEELLNTIDADTGEVLKGVLNADLVGLDQETVDECERARKCRDEQRKKIEDHIRYLVLNAERLGYDLYFGTWTFTDEALQLKARTRRECIAGLLKATCADYILNIDYGKTTDREHYHGIIAVPKGSYEITSMVWSEKYHTWLLHLDILDKYKMGYYDVQKIGTDQEDIAKLSRYIAKLTQHSIKVAQSYVSVKKGTEYQQHKKRRQYQRTTHQEMTMPYLEDSAKEFIESEDCTF